MSADSLPRFAPARRRAVVGALALVSALASFESTVVSTAMPTIIGDLSGLPLYSWVFSLYLLSATVMMPLFGSLADIHGRRRVLLAALALFLSGAAACALARSMPQLIAARALQGLGAAGLIPVALTVVADLYTLQERGRIQALFSSIWACAALMGPLLGAWLTIGFGWRSIFWVTLPLGLLVLALVGARLKESRAPRPAGFDFAGAALLAVSVSALLFATLHGGASESMGVPARAALLALAAFSFLGFSRLQGRTAHPLIPPALFARRETAAPYVAGILLGITIFGVDTFVPLFVQGARGGSAAAAGAVVTPIVFMWAVSGWAAGHAIVAFGFRRTARFGAALVQLGSLALLLAVLRGWSVLAISLSCALIGAGLGPSSLSQILAVQHSVREADRGVATSLVPFMRTVGGSVGVGALGAVLSAGLARRLGAAAADAGQFLTARPAAETLASAAFRDGIHDSLLPIFGFLAALAALNLFVTGYFPGEADAPG